MKVRRERDTKKILNVDTLTNVETLKVDRGHLLVVHSMEALDMMDINLGVMPGFLVMTNH